MIYGLYLSAAGVVANSHRQDVISNNLANSETVGFKRDLAAFQRRPMESALRGTVDPRNPLDSLGGGIFATPTMIDLGQGSLEQTGNPLDVGLQGKGFLSVSDGKTKALTRDGKLAIDPQGNLIVAADHAYRVLDPAGRPIRVDPARKLVIHEDGRLSQDGDDVGALGLLDADAKGLRKLGGNLLTSDNARPVLPGSVAVQAGFVEQSNADPTTELTQLMDTQRQLEANANMIRYQDQMLSRLVNEVGKIS